MARKQRSVDALTPLLTDSPGVSVLPPEDDLDVGGVLPAHSVRVLETRDDLRSAVAFLVKYAGLAVALLVLTVAGVLILEVRFIWTWWTWGVLLVLGYALLSYLDHRFSAYGVERERLYAGASVLRADIDARKSVQLAVVSLQQEQMRAQAEYNRESLRLARDRAYAQLSRHETPQHELNRLHNYVAPVRDVDIDALQAPAWWHAPDEPQVRDNARRALVDFVCRLYERDNSGERVHLHEDGRIKRHVRVPAGVRGGLPPDERAQLVDLLRTLERTGAWLLKYDEQQRLWRLNVERYGSAEEALDAVDTVSTAAV